MTLTTLDPVEFVAPDMAIECDWGDCSGLATQAMRTFCCVRLYCTACTAHVVTFVGRCVPGIGRCIVHPHMKKRCIKISDFIVSVDPL